MSYPPGFDDELFKQVDEVAGVYDDFTDGIGLKKSDDGIDFSIEFPKLNGGPLLWSIIDHMNFKRVCLDKQSTEERCMFKV